jgi:hypothetical protein
VAHFVGKQHFPDQSAENAKQIISAVHTLDFVSLVIIY